MSTPDRQPAGIEAGAPPPSFGAVVRQLRARRGMTQAQVGDALGWCHGGTVLCRREVQRLEAITGGAWSVGLLILIRIADALALTTAERIALITAAGYVIDADGEAAGAEES